MHASRTNRSKIVLLLFTCPIIPASVLLPIGSPTCIIQNLDKAKKTSET
jgi:hypothetical protein